jgi:hypothetical protein
VWFKLPCGEDRSYNQFVLLYNQFMPQCGAVEGSTLSGRLVIYFRVFLTVFLHFQTQ